MDNKEKYLLALKNNKGRHDEISLGETLVLNEETTTRIISQLLSEFRIDYFQYGECNYKVMKKSVVRSKK